MVGSSRRSSHGFLLKIDAVIDEIARLTVIQRRIVELVGLLVRLVPLEPMSEVGDTQSSNRVPNTNDLDLDIRWW